jgi:hypothetical protein
MPVKTAPVLPTRLRTVTTTAITVGAFDQNAIIVGTNAGAIAATLPESTATMFPDGTVITFIQGGAGAITVSKTGSDTIIGTVATTAAGDTLYVTKISATGWSSAFAT